MGTVYEVDDPDDPRLADYRSLTDVALRSSIEAPHGLFIAEGALVIERARAAGYSLRSALMTPEWLERTAPVLSNSDAPVYLGSDATLRALTGFHVHRGALASVQRQPLRTLGDVIRSARRLAVIEDMVNHTNLGAIFRTAAALGVDGVVISPRAADPLYRRSVRVSMGAVFTVPYARAETWPDAIDEVKAAGFRTLALTPRDGALDLGEVAVDIDDRLAIVVGTEGEGLSDEVAERCEVAVRIPMSAGIDSLNVATAAGIAFWELRR
ncbi:MAG TPA: RNA methyltransferase [Mycobacteriales bacterium]|jgi:tRNA G18 (ribose-2'-O)-methylase SpoU|nr:RNA methyltransferase [Mycobacteriales bacterium]